MSGVVNSVHLEPRQLARYEQDGFLRIPGLIRPDLLAGLREEVTAVLMAETGLSEAALFEATTMEDRLRQSQAYLRGSLIDEMINGAEMLSLAGQLIGGKAVRYNPFTAFKGKGGGTFDFHQDNNYTEHRPALGSVNIWVALVDMHESNGCLRMVPGSHKMGTLTSTDAGDGVHRKVDNTVDGDVPIELRAGDAVAFTRLTIHGSGPNASDAPRFAYALQYHRTDVEFFDTASDRWVRLVDVPRFSTPPLESLGAA